MREEGDGVLVLGPPLAGGAAVRGVIVGLMHMEDETGLDSKVVISPVGPDGRARYPLRAADQTVIGDYFARYKSWEPGTFSRVPGWGTAAEGRAYVARTHAFFIRCRARPARECRVTL